MAANTRLMHNNEQITCQFSDLQDKKLLTLSRRSFSECSREHVTSSFALKYGQYDIYHHLHPITT